MTKLGTLGVVGLLSIASHPGTLALASVAEEPSNSEAFSAVQCQHFWERSGRLEASGKPVGIDVGTPPSGEYSRFGTYLCHVTIRRSDAVNGKYLFIGEVGDASYLELQAVNGRPIQALPINHGLSPDEREKPVYMRYLPFVVSVRDLYVEDGVHEFKIRYKDIFPLQVGIRSGIPTIEPFTGVLRRGITCSPTFTFHVIQFLVFVLVTITFAAWPGLRFSIRLIFSSASAAAAGVILQLSAVPRSFLPEQWATRLNDFSQLLSFPLLGAALLIFFHPTRPELRSRIAGVHLALANLAVLILSTLGARDLTYIRWYGAFLLILGGVPCLVLGYGIRKGWLTFTGGPKAPPRLPYALMVLGGLYAVDIFNLVARTSAHYYFNHFLFFSTIILAVWRLQSEVSPNEVTLRATIADQNKRAYSAIASNSIGEYETLDTLVQDLSKLFGSDRMAVQEIIDRKLRFVGYSGSYTDTQGLHEIRVHSLVERAIESRQIQFGRMPSKVRSGTETDVFVVPLENNAKVIGVLCATEFRRGALPRFYRDRMNLIKQECQPVLALLLAERHNRAKDRLIQMSRNRTHPLQLESEEYFLKNFDISPTLKNHAFIYGDLVGSVDLNERYKATKAVERAIDEHLALIWQRFKHLGLVVSRTRGDMISFVVPNQLSDVSERDAVRRCFEILRFIPQSYNDLRAIGKKHKIELPLRYRFAMSRIDQPLVRSSEDEALMAFTVLVDTSIDEVARAAGVVAMDGECLVFEAAKHYLEDDSSLLELDPQWLKGKSIPVRIWSLNGNVLKKAS